MDRHRELSSMLIKSVLVIVLFQVTVIDSYKILMVFPSYSQSHLIIGSSLLKGLAEAGHEVTMVSSFPRKQMIPNYRDIYVDIPVALKNLFEDAVAKDGPQFSLNTMYQFVTNVLEYSNNTMALPEMQKIMSEESFDLVITSVFGGRMQSGLAAHFGCPLAYIFPVKTTLNTAYMMGNPIQLATVPSIISVQRNPLRFLDRVKSFIVSGLEYGLFSFFDALEWYYYRSNFPSPKYPSYLEASRNASLVLSAYHFSQGPIATVPAIVEIGGIQMDTKLAPLPHQLQQFLDQAEEGVIYFSFGTNVKLKKQNQMRMWSIYRALEKSKMKVLMKYDTDEGIHGLSKDILTASWLPQREILAHPNVKLFISHGGLGGMMESKYYGVPVLGIPIFGDQPGNVRMAVKEGWAVEVDFYKLTEQKMTRALRESLKNSSYSETVKEFSVVYRDRPMGPMKTAIYWVEYVIRHGGAPHMRSPAAKLNLLQRNSLDVIAFLCLIVYLFVLALKYSFIGFIRLVQFLVLRMFEKKEVGSAKKKLK